MKIVHFNNGTGGGVLSVISNLLAYCQHSEIENHVIYTINKKKISHFEVPSLVGAKSEKVFYYSPNWNFYYTCRELQKLLPDSKAVIVAHDWLELGMVSNLGLQNPVVFFLHGNYDYYYRIAIENSNIINKFICVSPIILNELSKRNPLRKNDAMKVNIPVPSIKKSLKPEGVLTIIYIAGNLLDENKKSHLLPEIDNLLKKRNIVVNWRIVGMNGYDDKINVFLDSLQNIVYYPYLKNKSILSVLEDCHLFILPSINEGFPVSLIESMKAGLVPLVTNWSQATEELLIDNQNGFYLPINDAQAYANKIILLNENRLLLKSFSESAANIANRLFNPYSNTDFIEKIFIKSIDNNRVKVAKKIYGSKLDHPLIPSALTNIIRKFYL
jgi:glycosyltransferase involved in cell wall biosynthesis